MPVESPHILQPSHLLVSQVGDNLKHTSAIAVEAKDIEVDELAPIEELKGERGSADASK